MGLSSATSPGRAGTPNQDLVITAPDLVVLLDGAGGPSEDGGGCLHGVRWYVRQLGSRLSAALLTRPDPIATVLAEAITEVAGLHRTSCDLLHPGTPSSTVAVVRRRAEHLEYLALHDSTIVLAGPADCRTVSDRRVQRIPALRELWQRMARHAVGTAGHTAARRAYIAEELPHRNTPGGYWVAGADPRCAEQAVSGTVPLAGLRSVSLASDGVADYVDAPPAFGREVPPTGLTDWPGAVGLLDRHGPEALIRKVRSAEELDPLGRRWPRFKKHDDATVAHWRL
ncbi:protein phosphatase 2C domain-containing protein [Kitasatospora viridis]|uniref:Protein phosphatase 2C-like protein n=1 Tax=Kitasatospora viridis TaxID=281105 RepID=A0A561TTA0_9ACTN|nr:protein phosphatase 2C domain-containing protein [Kitasatospora viridis]TWF90320.1 protein phosphatase 2C-like protein [Kitasatospora viridis]